MKKRFFSLAIVAALVGTMAAGCYSQGEATGSDTSAADSSTAVTDTSAVTPVTDTASAPSQTDTAKKDSASKM